MDIYVIVWIAFAFAGVITAAKFMPSLAIMAGFTYPNAKFNAIGSPYLQEKELSRLINSKNLEDFKNNVAGRDFVLEGKSVREIQKSIDESFARIVDMAGKDSPKTVRKFYDAYLQKLDGRLIKDAIKAILEGKKIGDEKAFSPAYSEFMKRVKGAGKDELLGALAEFGMDEAKKLIEANAPFVEIEYAIDKKVMESIGKASVPRSCSHARDVFVKKMIDIFNLKAIFRAKYYGMKGIENMLFGDGREISKWKLEHMLKIKSIPEIISLLEGTSYIKPLRDAIPQYEKEGVPALEIALDRHLIKMVADITLEHSMNLGPGIRFIVENEFEARNLKAIAKGIGEGLPPQRIWKLMVIE
ncbi:MAG: V-type ATPase subunit [Candidatus Thermoplasmatota archaeon]|nr:V-type ATPase subunit [Candidatus Thermoplasmatota archaeon]